MQEAAQSNPLETAKNAINGKLVNELATILLQVSDIKDQEKSLRQKRLALQAREQEIRAMVKGVEHFVGALLPMTSVVSSQEGTGAPQPQPIQPDLL